MYLYIEFLFLASLLRLFFQEYSLYSGVSLCFAALILRPSAPGSGVIAGSSIRTVLELAGVKNILSKQLGSGNLLNNARATVNGLSTLRSYNS